VTRRLAPTPLLLAAIAVASAGCHRSADLWLVGSLAESSAEGVADDGSDAAPSSSYDTSSADLWAQDSLTTAHSDPPRPGRLAGGVAAQPSDTARGLTAPTYASARSVSRMAVPLDVRSAGRAELELVLRLSDVEVAGAGVPRIQVTATLKIGPNGEVVVDGLPDEMDQLLPNGSYERVIGLPAGGEVSLDEGEYRVAVELAIEATAPAASGGYQLARIGQASVTLRVP
jgi:hypothetical protein